MTIRLALLGTWHVHALHHLQDAQANPDADIVVVWDSDTARGQQFAEKHGLPFEADLGAVLACDDLQAVVIDTATVEHPEVIGAAIAAKKHVFTEKVLAIEPADAHALADAAREAGIVMRVSLQRMIEAPIQTAAHLVRAGRVGKVNATRIRYAHSGAFGSKWIPAHFFDRKQAGGGAILDLGAHPIYLGMLFHDAHPKQVQALSKHLTGMDIEDNAVMMFDYPDGAVAVAETSFVAGFFDYSVEIVGEGGTIAIGPTDSRVLLREKESSEWVPQDLQPALPCTLDQFILTLKGEYPDDHNLEVALAVTNIMAAAYKSAASGQAVLL